MSSIKAAHLNKSFRKTQAVKDLNLDIKAGEIYGLVGPDGAGKTTTIRLLCGALKPDPAPDRDSRPTLMVGGRDMLQSPENARESVGYLPQRFSLYEELTVLENLRFFAEVRGLPTQEWRPRSLEILRFVGLEKFQHRRAGRLSGGMKQKLSLAIALVHQPRVLLLDEPTTGVDPLTRQDFWQLIIELVQAGDQQEVAVLVSTPYMDEASRCTRVGFMRGGQILVEGTPQELCQGLLQPILELQGHPLKLLRGLAEADPDVQAVQLFGDRLHLRVDPGKAKKTTRRLTRSIRAQGGEISQLRQIRTQLEDVFIALIERSHD